MSDPQAALVRVSQALRAHGIAHMVIGGMAAIHWGEARTTRDLDLTVHIADGDIGRLVACVDSFGRSRVSDAGAFAAERRVLPAITDDGVPVDLILATLTFEIDAIARAEGVDVGGTEVPHISPADLIVHKIVSPRPIDLQDVVAVLIRQKDLNLASLRTQVAQLAGELAEPEILNRFDAAVHSAGR